MTEVIILKLLDAALSAAAVGIEREQILDRVAQRQAQGATPEQLAEELAKMRDEAIAAAQAKIDGAAG